MLVEVQRAVSRKWERWGRIRKDRHNRDLDYFRGSHACKTSTNLSYKNTSFIPVHSAACSTSITSSLPLGAPAHPQPLVCRSRVCGLKLPVNCDDDGRVPRESHFNVSIMCASYPLGF